MKLENFKNTHDISDALVSLFGIVFSIGGILEFIQAGLAIVVSALTAVWLFHRIRRIRRDERND